MGFEDALHCNIEISEFSFHGEPAKTASADSYEVVKQQ